MNILIVYKLLDVFTTYDSCLTLILSWRIQNQCVLFYLKYFVLYELMHNPTPSFAEEQMLFSHFK